jgi:hypothetical protein
MKPPLHFFVAKIGFARAAFRSAQAASIVLLAH